MYENMTILEDDELPVLPIAKNKKTKPMPGRSVGRPKGRKNSQPKRVVWKPEPGPRRPVGRPKGSTDLQPRKKRDRESYKRSGSSGKRSGPSVKRSEPGPRRPAGRPKGSIDSQPRKKRDIESYKRSEPSGKQGENKPPRKKIGTESSRILAIIAAKKASVSKVDHTISKADLTTLSISKSNHQHMINARSADREILRQPVLTIHPSTSTEGKYIKYPQCEHILTKGANIGKRCEIKVYEGGTYCRSHE